MLSSPSGASGNGMRKSTSDSLVKPEPTASAHGVCLQAKMSQSKDFFDNSPFLARLARLLDRGLRRKARQRDAVDRVLHDPLELVKSLVEESSSQNNSDVSRREQRRFFSRRWTERPSLPERKQQGRKQLATPAAPRRSPPRRRRGGGLSLKRRYARSAGHEEHEPRGLLLTQARERRVGPEATSRPRKRDIRRGAGAWPRGSKPGPALRSLGCRIGSGTFPCEDGPGILFAEMRPTEFPTLLLI